jgi:hypothetical protein
MYDINEAEYYLKERECFEEQYDDEQCAFLRVSAELARRVVLRAAMYSLLSWTGCLRWLNAAVMNL